MEFTAMEIAQLKMAVAYYGMHTVEEMDEYARQGDWETYSDLNDLNADMKDLLEKLKQCKVDSGKKFFAKFKGIPTNEIAMFNTKAERDKWVNFQDEFSIAFGTTKENAAFQREAITESDAADLVFLPDEYGELNTERDRFVKGLKWIIIRGVIQ